MPQLSRRALAAAAIALFPALPAAAEANVTVERTGSQVTIVATGASNEGEVNVSQFSTPSDDPDYPEDSTTLLVDSNGLGAIESSTCTTSGDDVVYCGDADLSEITIDLSGTSGGASVSLEAGIVADDDVPSVEITGSPGADSVWGDEAATYGIAFAGGDGDDTARLGGGNDLFTGGAGNDRFRTNPGDDTFEGGAGNDELDAGDAPDGSDVFDGGTDDASIPAGLRGDTVVYSDREAPVTVQLAPIGASVPAFGGGAAGENDGFLGVESVDGGQGSDALYGNDGDNDLWGREGNDLIDGGAGDDVIYGDGGADDLRGGDGDDFVAARMSDADTALSCGAGTDRIVRDLADPAHSGCETDAPGFVAQRVTISGSLNVGSTLTAASLQTFGDPGTVTTGWATCATVEFDDCRDVGSSSTYVLQPADLGRFVYAFAAVADAGGTTDQIGSEVSAAVAAAVPGPVATPIPTPTPIPAFGVRAAASAMKALGGNPGLAKGFVLGVGVQVFVPQSGSKPKAVKLTGKKAVPVAAVVCEAACKLKSELSVTVTSKKTKKKSTIKLPVTKQDLKPGEAAVVKAKLSAAAKKAVASSASKPVLTVKLTIGEGKTKKTASQKLKVAKP